MVYTGDLKSPDRKVMPVRVRPGAPTNKGSDVDNWLPFNTYPLSDPESREMFVVIAIDTPLAMPGTGKLYTTDPYCVWRQDGRLVRWPHPFAPTHWMPLPKVR